jgi:hypothetical protein
VADRARSGGQPPGRPGWILEEQSADQRIRSPCLMAVLKSCRDVSTRLQTPDRNDAARDLLRSFTSRLQLLSAESPHSAEKRKKIRSLLQCQCEIEPALVEVDDLVERRGGAVVKVGRRGASARRIDPLNFPMSTAICRNYKRRQLTRPVVQVTVLRTHVARPVHPSSRAVEGQLGLSVVNCQFPLYLAIRHAQVSQRNRRRSTLRETTRPCANRLDSSASDGC